MTVNTITMGPGSLKLGETGTEQEFSQQLSSLTITVSVKKGDAVAVLSGENAAGDRTVTYTMKGTLVQDFGAPDSLVEYCYEHDGESTEYTFVPNDTCQKSISGTVTIDPVDIGGDAASKPTSDFEFDLGEKPAFTALTPPAE